MMEKFWTWFGRADNIVGIGTAVISLCTLWLMWRQERRLRAQAREEAQLANFADLRAQHEGIKSAKPVAFALSLIPTSESIKGSVETFLRSQGWQIPIEELNRDGLNNAADLEAFINALREMRRYLDAAVQAETIIGSVLRNWIPVKLYHKPTPAPPQVYEYWMPLL